MSCRGNNKVAPMAKQNSRRLIICSQAAELQRRIVSACPGQRGVPYGNRTCVTAERDAIHCKSKELRGMDSTLSHLKDLGERVETRQSRRKQCHCSRLGHRVWSSRKREGDAVVSEVAIRIEAKRDVSAVQEVP